ncbi:MAG: hypothetical protein JST93_09320 [Acidobacteria bacterium]|nr:hypothetical protein [Acidobacteriota bacterium]
MATEKITITLPGSQLKEIRGLVAGGKAASVSGFVKHAVGLALSDVAEWKSMLAEALEATGGPLTKQEREWADSILAPAKNRRRGKRSAA